MAESFLNYTGLQFFYNKLKAKFSDITHSHKVSDLQPITSKTYTDLRYNSSQIYHSSYRFWTLANVKPNSYDAPCWVRFRIHCSTTLSSVQGDYDITLAYRRRNNGTTNDYPYSSWKTTYNQGDNPGVALRYFGTRGLTATGISNQVAIPFGWYQGDEYGANTYTRTFKLEVIEAVNCTVTWPDTPAAANNLRASGINDDANYQSWSSFWIGTSQTSQSGDANDYAHTVSHYYTMPEVGGTGCHVYSIIMMDKDGKYQSIQNENNTHATTKTANTAQFQVNRQLFFYNSGTNRTSGRIGGAELRTLQLTCDMRYSLNITASAGTCLTGNKPLYLKGSIDSDGYFKLDTTTWWSQTVPTTEDGKIYIYIGWVHPDTNPYRCNVELEEVNNAYWFKDGLFRHYPEAGGIYTSAEQTKLAGIETGAQKNTVTSVNSKTGAVSLSATDVNALPVNNPTATGTLTAPVVSATSYFVTPHIVGQGDLSTYYHRLDFGYASHDVWDFYEYGGIYNFYKNTSADGSGKVLLGKICTNGWEGNVKGNVTGTASFATVAETANDPTKLPLAGGTMTGNIVMQNSTVTLVGTASYATKAGTALDDTKLSLTGGTLSGKLQANGGIALNSNTKQQTPAYILGIKAFADGGDIIWQTKDTVAVGTASYTSGTAVYAITAGTANDPTKLPLAGGTITGTTDSTSMATGALIIKGGAGIAKNLSASSIKIADKANIIYDSTNECIKFTFS